MFADLSSRTTRMRNPRAVALAFVLLGIAIYNRSQHVATHSRVGMTAGVALMLVGLVFVIAARRRRSV